MIEIGAGDAKIVVKATGTQTSVSTAKELETTLKKLQTEFIRLNIKELFDASVSQGEMNSNAVGVLPKWGEWTPPPNFVAGQITPEQQLQLKAMRNALAIDMRE